MCLTRWMVCAGLMVFAGCHGMTIKPMPERMNEQAQSNWDEAWRHFAASQPNILREEILDVMLVRQAWHVGVDTLEMRSMKRIGSHKIVMETTYDRSRPDDDAFTITFLDVYNRPVRTERYSAEELSKALDSLLILESLSAGADEAAVARHHEAVMERDRRSARVHELFPIPEEEGKPEDSAE